MITSWTPATARRRISTSARFEVLLSEWTVRLSCHTQATIVRSDIWRNGNSPRRSLPMFFRGYSHLLHHMVPHAHVDVFSRSRSSSTLLKNYHKRFGVPCHGTEPTTSSRRYNPVHAQPSCRHSAHSRRRLRVSSHSPDLQASISLSRALSAS